MVIALSASARSQQDKGLQESKNCFKSAAGSSYIGIYPSLDTPTALSYPFALRCLSDRRQLASLIAEHHDFAFSTSL